MRRTTTTTTTGTGGGGDGPRRQRLLDADPHGLARRVADLAGLDRERVLLWLFARCVQESPGWPSLADVAHRIARRGRRTSGTPRSATRQNRPVPAPRSFTAVVATDARRRVLVPLPFDPDEAWGCRHEHRVAGTVGGAGVRAVVEPLGDGHGILLGPAWRRDCGVGPGDEVAVVLAPEGPQQADLAPDVAAALEAEPAAGAFFDSLARFYRRAYLGWIDATKRRPEARAARIAEAVEHLKAGRKERPRSG